VQEEASLSQTRAVLPREDDLAPFSDVGGHRRRSTRQVRHESKAKLHDGLWDDDALEDAICPVCAHDVGRKTSHKPRPAPKPGRRDGFKVWKTPFWKRRSKLRAERNAAERTVAESDTLTL